MKRLRRDERGATAVEFALVMPILFMVVFAIISFGFLFAQDLALSNAARQTARYGVVQGHSCDAIATQAIDAAAPLVTLTAADVTVTRGTTPGAATDACGTTTIEPCKESAVDDNLYVRIDFTADVLLPIFPGMGSQMDLDGEGVFRCEFA